MVLVGGWVGLSEWMVGWLVGCVVERVSEWVGG